MSSTDTMIVPPDLQDNLSRLSAITSLTPVEVLRAALDLYMRRLESDDAQAAQRAESATPRAEALERLIERGVRPARWADGDEPLF